MNKNSYGARPSLRLAAAILAALGFVLFLGFVNPHFTHAAAGTNQQLNYQGRLLDSTGAVVADGTYNMEFKIYQDGTGCVAGGSSPCGGTLKWTETRIQTNRVTVKNGYFSVNLGSITAFGASVDWNQDTLWLSINIGGVTNTPTPTWDGEMTPFKRLTSTPYALNSYQLGGLQAANFVQLAQGVQTDTSTANASIFVNKNNSSGTPNILELQKSSSDVFVIGNGGSLAVTPSDNTATILLGTTAETGTVTLGQYNGASTSIINIGANSGASSTQQINIGSSSSGINTVVLGSSSSSSTTTLNGGTGGINLNPNGSSNTGVILKPTNNSTAAFQLQSATAADTLLTADTTNNKIVIGNATGTNSATTQLIVDAATADPTTGYTGGIYYNSTNDKFRCYQAGAWADCLGATQNSTLSMVSGLANAASNTAGQAVETLVFTTATAVSNTAGATGFTAAAGGSFRTCLIKNNATVTAGTLTLRWRVNGTSVGSGACVINSTTNTRSSSSALDAGVVTFSQGDTIGIAFDTDATYAPATDDYTVFWTIEYNSTLTNAGATLQSAYNNYNVLTTTDTHDLLVNAADTATDANLVFNLQCVTSCGANGRFAVQNGGTDVLTVSPNSGNITLAPAGAGSTVVSADGDSNLQINYASTNDATLNIANISITDNASASTGALYGLAVINNDNGANTGVPDALAYLKNANAAETVVDGLLIEQTGAGTLTNGLEIKQTAGTVTNGLSFTGTFGTSTLKVGANTILNGTGVLQSVGLSGTYSNALTLSSTTNSYSGNTATIAATAVPGTDIVTISNSGQGVTTAGVNGLQLTYVGGAANIESSGEDIGLTGGTTAGGIWNGLRLSQGTITGGTTVQDIKLETAALTTTSAATVINGLNLPTAGAINSSTAGSIAWAGLNITNANVTQGAGGTASATGLAVAIGSLTTGGTQYGLNITGSSSNAAGTETGINIGNITAGAATETGLLIGTGWDEAIRANGIVTVGAQTDTASTGSASYSLTNSAAGTYGSAGADTNRDKIASSVVYKGKLFVSTAETNLAGVYRYDGGANPWTLVTSTTLGKALSTDSAADADAFVMTVFDGKLWIGSQTANATAAVYSSTTADTASAGDNFTLINSARGTLNAGTQAGIQDMTVYNGNLIVSTQKTDSAEIDRYEGGTTFTRINATVGKSAAETTADKDAFNLTVCANVLYAGSVSGSTTGIVASYQGNGTTWINTTVTLTGGSYGAETLMSDINSMACSNGNLFIATSKTAGNAAAIYYYKATPAPVANVAANFVRINTAVGKMQAADAAIIDSFILRNYNGRLYAGSQTAAGEDAGALFEYTGIPLADFPLMTVGARGTFGSQVSVNAISMLQTLDGTLYVGTDDGANNIGSVYTWSKTSQNSFALKFDSGNSNYGSISFAGDRQSGDNSGHYGSFLFSNSIQMASGSFDYAEDYASLDSSLSAGEPVAVDPSKPGYVKRAGKTDTILGVVSKNPGFRLSASVAPEGGGEWLPIALVGRVPVRVSGNVNSGDKLSILTPGVLHKAGPGEQVAGVALEGFSGDGVGSVSMFVHPQWSSDGGDAALQDAGAQGVGLKLNAGTDYNPNLFNMLGSDGQSVASIDSVGNATFKGTVTADKIKANQIEGLEIITDKISSLSAQLAKQQTVKTAGASPPVNLNNLTNVQAVSLSVLAQIEAHGGLIVDKDAQFNGKTIFALLAQFNGPVKFNGPVSFNSDAGGTALIKKDAKKVDIKFSKEYTGTPIISANYLFNGLDISADQDKQQRLLDGGYSFVVSQTTSKGFTIVLNKAATEDISFSWLATLINNPQISQSQPVSTASQ